MRAILFLIAALAAACGPRAVPPPEPAPAPATVSAGAQRPPPPASACQCAIPLCTVRNGGLVPIPALYNAMTGDTMTLDSLPFSSAAPLTGEYASVAGWYVDREPILFRGRPYTMYGRPRVLGIPEVVPVGSFDRVPVFAEAADTASASGTVYLPTRPGCEFQPYVRAAPR